MQRIAEHDHLPLGKRLCLETGSRDCPSHLIFRELVDHVRPAVPQNGCQKGSIINGQHTHVRKHVRRSR